MRKSSVYGGGQYRHSRGSRARWEPRTERCRATGHTGVHVIAHDVGGAVALRARLLHGASYASLCLIDVVALSPWGSLFFNLVKQQAHLFEQLPPHVHRGAVQAYISDASHRGLTAELTR
jgi:pimeloyl-ACP methyl ester carboxylesterase